jgi:hypothetical protein
MEDLDFYENSKHNLKTFWGLFLNFIFPYRNSAMNKIINLKKEDFENSKNFVQLYQERINEYENKLFGEVDELIQQCKSYLVIEGKH